MRQGFMSCTWALLFALLLPGISSAANPNEFLAGMATDPDPSTGFQLPYRLFVPLNYDPTKKYPLVLFMHGSGEDGTDNKLQVQRNIDNLFAHVKMPAYSSFLLVPQTIETADPYKYPWLEYEGIDDDPDKYNNPISASLRTTLSVITGLENTYNIDQSRLYVTGLSLGGGGTWDIIQRRPGMFAAAVPICGYGDTSKASLLVDQPIWAFHAKDDNIVPFECTSDLIDGVKAAGGNPIFTQLNTGGHNIWETAYTDTAVYDWMFSQHTVTPEPGSLVLGASGIAAIGCYLACRRSRRT
jgi:predicted peptidase